MVFLLLIFVLYKQMARLVNQKPKTAKLTINDVAYQKTSTQKLHNVSIRYSRLPQFELRRW